MADADSITFKCLDCSEPLVAEDFDPSNDKDIFMCHSCGRKFGTHAEVYQAMVQLGKNEIDKMTDKANLPPWITRTWT